MITQIELKKILHYDPEEGVFTWLVRTTNSIHVGDIAGTLQHAGYVRIKIFGVLYGAHQLAWLYMVGMWPVDEIDHHDTIRNNNRWKNLRPATHAINMQNQRKAHCDNKTGFQGVSPNGKGFQAGIHANEKKHYLGTYSTPQEAHAVYLDAKRKMHPGCTL